MLVCSVLSMRVGLRYSFILCGCMLSMVGLAIELAQPREEGIKYLGLFFLTTGSYIVMPITVVSLSINVRKGYQRAAALGLLAPISDRQLWSRLELQRLCHKRGPHLPHWPCDRSWSQLY
jgi:hypothetical protein